MSDSDDVVDNQTASRFELAIDGHLAHLDYEVNGSRLTLTHTEVPEELGGRGLGGHLVRAAVNRAEREHLTVIPNCPFARSWLDKHPDVAATITMG
jgi:predicted GNAT family acetyltransferase